MKELIQLSNKRPTREIMVGDIPIGGGSPISIQTMTTTLTHDVDATLAQVEQCAEAGAQIVRVAVPEEPDAKALSTLVKRAPVPIVSDIHFNYRYALAAVDAGVAKVRINPGNIGSEKRIAEVLSAAKAANIPIRIGVNEGSLEKDLLEKYPSPTAEALVESAMRHVNICEEHDFRDIAISVKSSDPLRMIEANRQLSAKVPYPLHLGVTEAGTPRRAHVLSLIHI